MKSLKLGTKTMSGKPSKPETDSEAAAEAASPAKVSLWRRLFTKRWFAVLLVLSVVVHGLMLVCWPAAVRSKLKTPSEVELGEFRFHNSEQKSRLATVQFKLHVSLLMGTESIGGSRLVEKKFLVQQGIEELLRQAHAGDFEDPTLSELKRQIQEKINEAVELRTVEEVIITQLETEERPPGPRAAVTSFEAAAEAGEAVRRASPVRRMPAEEPAADASQPEESSLYSGAAG